MGIRSLFFAAALWPAIAGADTFMCAGTAPNWSLSMDDQQARFEFDNRSGDFEVMLRTPAEGQDWPQAFTLISSVDTAIAIVDQRHCGTDSYSAQILTQRNVTAVLLIGCCSKSTQ